MKKLSFNLFILVCVLLFTGCPQDSIFGCMNADACNYNPESNEDDGTCQVPLDNPIEVVFYDQQVVGSVNEELTAHIHVRNSSCENLILDASQSPVHPSKPFVAKFCLGDICYDWGTNDAAVTLTLESFEEGDYVQGYIQADEPGTYEMTYSLFDDVYNTEVTVTFEVN